jgi:hypothetical protein
MWQFAAVALFSPAFSNDPIDFDKHPSLFFENHINHDLSGIFLLAQSRFGSG